MLLATAIRQFLEGLTKDPYFSRHTIKSYDHHLRRFWDFSGRIDTSGITADLVRSYAKYLSKQGLKKSTQNYYLIALRSLLSYLQKNFIASLAPEEIHLTSFLSRQTKRDFSRQLRLVIEAANTNTKVGLRDRAILEILHSTGLRVSALVKLNRQHINISGQSLEVDEQNYPLSDSAIFWLETYLKSRQDSFIPLLIRWQGKINLENDGESMRLTARSVERIVKKYAKLMQLADITPETFRLHFGLSLVSHGVDLKTVAKRLGHKHTVTTRAYLRSVQP